MQGKPGTRITRPAGTDCAAWLVNQVEHCQQANSELRLVDGIRDRELRHGVAVGVDRNEDQSAARGVVLDVDPALALHARGAP